MDAVNVLPLLNAALADLAPAQLVRDPTYPLLELMSAIEASLPPLATSRTSD